MAFLANCKAFKRHHSLAVSRAKSLVLFTTCVACIALLILLFLVPELFLIDSLHHVTDGLITPSVAIGLLTTLLGGSLSPLLTTAVEHSFWLKLSARQVQRRLTVAECHRLAQWSVSVLHQLSYVLDGQSKLLRLGGPLLFATAVLGPVLQAGVSPHLDTSTTSSTSASSADPFAGFLDRSNSAYNGGNFQDNLMTAAALAQMGGLKAPASSLCSSPACRVEAQAAAIQAQCQGRESTNPNGLGLQSALTIDSGEFCSDINPALCVTLERNDPATFVNFTTGYPPRCDTLVDGANLAPGCAGEWATIFGAWVNAADASYNSTLPINTVDCAVRFGNVTITQQGGASPVIDRDSFASSAQTFLDLGAAETAWRRIYTSEGVQSPYSFTALQGGASGANTLYEDNTLALLLLHYADADGADARAVASTIEANFDAGTLFAFARKPAAAAITTTVEATVNTWHYDARFLAILALPVLAMITVLWGRCRMGNADDVVTYLPVDIARRGPVGYVIDHEEGDYNDVVRMGGDLDEEKTLVWGMRESGGVKGGERGKQSVVKIMTASAESKA